MSCTCTPARTLLYSCSGAADVGLLADGITRSLARRGQGSMTCLAGVGGDLEGFLSNARSSENLVIDGCPVACGAAILKRHNLPFRHVVLTDLGPKKGATTVDAALVESLAERIATGGGAVR